ncbi:hypothetical protein M513_13858 [Trichuris suis]|uniref:Uncharacterized protein n=1 Tax=Trichuris suis TaxID=68888 RepID=A0A085LJX0_9BILA|nr:hypothetical protein M513_13858 [Trichuris suis]
MLLTSYCKGLVPVLGCFDAGVNFKGKSAHTTFDVAQYGKPLIGMDLISASNIAIRGSTLVSNIAEVTTEVRPVEPKRRNFKTRLGLKRTGISRLIVRCHSFVVASPPCSVGWALAPPSD